MFLCLWLILNTAFAQQSLTLKGSVKDSIGNPIARASVMITNAGSVGIAFGKTDDKGLFEHKFNADAENLSVKITALGYQQFISPIGQKYNGYLSVVLKQTVFSLAKIDVKANQKISLASDTLKYRVSGFSEGNDRVIADVIARLPGIQIEENGGISYNGKRIANLYIDGDNLLDGKYKLATNNIPVKAVEQIQVIERDQPVKALNGFVNANNVSLNIKLADSARAMMVNTGYIGVGNNAYAGELNNLVFKKNIKAINSLKTNNVGENLLAEQENVGVYNSADIVPKEPQTYLTIESEALPSLQDRYDLMNNDNAGSVNTLLKLKADWSLRINLGGLRLKRRYRYSNAVNYFFGNADDIYYNEAQNNTHALGQWLAQAQIEKNSKLIYLKSITKLALPAWERRGNTSLNNLVFDQNQPASTQSVSNETNLVKALGVGKIFQYNSMVQYNKVSESLQINPGILNDVVNYGKDYTRLNQSVNQGNVFIHQSATFKNRFNQFVFSASGGAFYERNQLNSGLYKTDSTGLSNLVGHQFKNDLDFSRVGWFVKLSGLYLLEKGVVSIEAAPTFNKVNYVDATRFSDKKNNYFLLNPIMEFRKNMGRYGELNFRYAAQTELGQVSDIYSGTILQNYRQLNFNDRPLPETDVHSLSTRFGYRNPLKMLFYSLNLAYEMKMQNFINSYVIESGLTKSIAINFKNRLQVYSLGGNLSKYLFFMATNLSFHGNAGLQTGNGFYNNLVMPYKAYQVSAGVGLRKKLFTTVSISLSGDMSRMINRQGLTGRGANINKTEVEKLKAEWIHQIADRFSYTLTYNLASYRQSGQQAVCNQFLDMNLRYSPKKWKSFFELQCINLLNQDFYTQITSNINQLSTYQLPLRQRTFLLKYVFEF